jgi:hypothetical protein
VAFYAFFLCRFFIVNISLFFCDTYQERLREWARRRLGNLEILGAKSHLQPLGEKISELIPLFVFLISSILERQYEYQQHS